MKQVRNIEVSQKADRNLQQGESCFKYVVVAFLALCWLCKSGDGSASLESVEVKKYSVAAVGNRPYHTEPGQDSSTLNLLADRFRSDDSHE